MSTQVQNRRANVIAVAWYIALFIAGMLLAGCTRPVTCPAYGYGYQEPKFRPTWNANQQPRKARKRTAHYQYRQKPNQLVEFFSRR